MSERESSGGQRLRGRFLLEAAVGAAIILLVAGLTHLSAILLLPSVATKDAYGLLAEGNETNTMVMLPASKPGDTLIPFRDPATIQGLCFYDLTSSPVRVRAKTEEGRLLTLSFRSPDGKVFYSMTDRAALRGEIDIRLVTAAQLKTVEDADAEDAELPTELRLKVPRQRGLLVATALIARPADRQDAEALIKAITCAPEPLPGS